MTDDLAQLRRRNLRTLGLLAGLFLLPLVAAFLLYYGSSWRPATRVNHGRLFRPAQALPSPSLPQVAGTPPPPGTRPAPPLRGTWSLVYVGDGACDAECRATLTVMRQARLALGTDMARVARVFLATRACCDRDYLAREHPGLTVLDASGPAALPLLGAFPAAGLAHTVFVVDPLGNLVLGYDAREDPHGLLADLKKLLRLSQIG